MTSQLNDSPRRFDWIACTLGLCGIFVGVLLFSRPTSHDSAIAGYYPHPFGEMGDWIRGQLFDSLGYGAFTLLFAWFVLGLTLIVHRSWLHWSVRLLGWLILIACSSGAWDWFANPSLSSPVAGPGGTIGAAIVYGLRTHFEVLGAYLLFGAGVLFGLLLAMDKLVHRVYRLIRVLVRTLWTIARTFISILFPSNIAEETSDPVPITVTRKPEVVVSPKKESPKVPSEKVESEVSPNIPITRSNVAPVITKHIPSMSGFELPSAQLLEDSQYTPPDNFDEKLRDVAVLLEKTFKDFGLNIRVVGIHTGPVITQYEIALETGLRVTKVTALSEDLALNLRVPSVRIVAPIPGKNTVGIEVPNEHRAVVRLKELITLSADKLNKSKLPLFLGKDSEGRALVYDLADMPHLLIAGRTGTGKSVCLNSIILSLLLTRKPDECRLLMIDPKQVELAEYGKLPHLMHPVVTDNSKAEAILSWAVDKMEERYEILRRSRVRNIGNYNELSHEEILRRVKPVDEEEKEKCPPKMPYIVIVIDEVGDLMMAMKKEVEGHIIRLAQKSRAAGIHLILTTQRPTVDVITGLIKSNLPARICFQVADRSNSRVVLDEVGAEKLLGKGDMLFLQPNTSTIVRAQGTYASDNEIIRIVGHLEVENPMFDTELLNLQHKQESPGAMIDSIRKRDELYEAAIEIVIREGRGSVSLLQRALGIGYGRAARLIDFMAEDGIVGHYNGAQAREVLFTPEQWSKMRDGDELGDDMAQSA